MLVQHEGTIKGGGGRGREGEEFWHTARRVWKEKREKGEGSAVSKYVDKILGMLPSAHPVPMIDLLFSKSSAFNAYYWTSLWVFFVK